MVTSLWLEFNTNDVELVKKAIIEDIGDIEKYNQMDANTAFENIQKTRNIVKERFSIDGGFTFKNKYILDEFLKNAIDEKSINEPVNCKCEWCKELPTHGAWLKWMFGFSFIDNRIGRNIWLMNMPWLSDDRLRLLHVFLLKVKVSLKKRDIDSFIWYDDIDNSLFLEFKKKERWYVDGFLGKRNKQKREKNRAT